MNTAIDTKFEIIMSKCSQDLTVSQRHLINDVIKKIKKQIKFKNVDDRVLNCIQY